jgi:hypothetical protein
MIRLPFNRCMVVTTLDFARIVDRLESAVYVDRTSSLEDLSWRSLADDRQSLSHKSYIGQIGSFKFSATRIIGYKYLHLPTFLSPTIEGQIDSLNRGYEISLIVKIQKATLVLLLAGLGGIFTSISSILDNLLSDVKTYQYLTNVELFLFLYMLSIAYLYFEAWRSIEFFKTLFAKRLEIVTNLPIEDRRSVALASAGNIRLGRMNRVRSTIDLLKKNLPSFPSFSEAPAKIAIPKTSTTDLLRRNLPSFPSNSDKIG